MLMPALAREGLDARGLMRLAVRMRRAEATIEFAVGAARAALAPGPWRERGPIVFDAARFRDLPAEVALRLLGRAVAQTGDEGPVELGKLEQLYEVLRQSRPPLRRTLAGRADHARGRTVNDRAGAGAPPPQPPAKPAIGALRNSSIISGLLGAFPWQGWARRLHSRYGT